MNVTKKYANDTFQDSFQFGSLKFTKSISFNHSK